MSAESPRPVSLERWRNPNGTYNGVVLMSDITGLSRDEIVWTWDRLKTLLDSGMEKAEALRLVKQQAKEQPWKNPPSTT